MPPTTYELVGIDEVYPTPRFWLEGQDRTLLQIQKNAFLLNWRKGASDYPHYEVVKEVFDQNYARFARFVDEQFDMQPTFQIAELSYINVIESCEYWQGPRDTNNVFPLFRATYCHDENDQLSFNQTATIHVASDLSLSVSIRNGRRQGNNGGGGAVLIFEFRAIGLLQASSKHEADLWFTRAHDAIGDCFLAITNPDIQQRYWRPV